MSSNFSNGGNGDFFSTTNSTIIRSNTQNINTNTYNNNTTNLINQRQQFSFPSPLSGFVPDPSSTQIRRTDFIGKRSFNDFQQQQQQQQTSVGFYNRNVKPRFNFHQQQQQQYSSPVSTLFPVDFSQIPSLSSVNSASVNPRYGFPILQQNRPQSWSLLNQNIAKPANNLSLPNLTQRNNEYSNNNNNSVTKISGLDSSDKKLMNQCLLELEKELLGDEEEIAVQNVSVLTDSEWSETIQNLLNNPISPSTSSSSCNSTFVSPPISSKQSVINAAIALSDSKQDVAMEILTRLQKVANVNGSPEQRLVSYMVSALKSRVSVNDRPNIDEINGDAHMVSTHVLYDVSPCFKLGFMAANFAILDAVNEQSLRKIHVVDFDIWKGGQYVHLLHALAATAKNGDRNKIMSLKITVVGSYNDRLKYIGEGLSILSQRLGVCFSFDIKLLNISDLTREKLEVQSDEALVVNFAFKMYKLPDESVTTENVRDELLRRVKSLTPVVTTLVEQEMNGNTAPLVTRVKEACEHYGALFESLEGTMGRDNSERVRIEQGLGRKVVNSVACEGRDRVERCEVFGKWRARMSMAGFQQRVMSLLAAESLLAKLNSGTRGNPGFTISGDFGGICFGWKGRTLTVASAWR